MNYLSPGMDTSTGLGLEDRFPCQNGSTLFQLSLGAKSQKVLGKRTMIGKFGKLAQEKTPLTSEEKEEWDKGHWDQVVGGNSVWASKE